MTSVKSLVLILVATSRGAYAFAPMATRVSTSSAKSKPSQPSFQSVFMDPQSFPMCPRASSHLNLGLDDAAEYGMLGSVLHAPEFWSSIIMLSIIGLLYTWEEAIHLTRKKVPQPLQPIVDSMLIEMGSLGFIGLFLSIAVINGPLEHAMSEISETFLGDEEILIESFEFLHTAFFETAIAFFAIAGITVWKTIKKIESLEDVSVAIFDLDGDGEVGCNELADYLQAETITVDTDSDGIQTTAEIEQALRKLPLPSIVDEVFGSENRIRAEGLVLRERFLETLKVKKSFKIENYFVPIFSENLEEIVELSPFTWLPLLPINALGRTVDISNHVVSAAVSFVYLSIWWRCIIHARPSYTHPFSCSAV